MFCEETIEEVYECINYSLRNVGWRFDCIDELAVHLTKGYRIILKTKTYYICISIDGVKVVLNTENIIMHGEELKATEARLSVHSTTLSIPPTCPRSM